MQSNCQNSTVPTVEDLDALLQHSFNRSLDVNIFGKLLTAAQYTELNQWNNNLNCLVWQSLMPDLLINQEGWMFKMPYRDPTEMEDDGLNAKRGRTMNDTEEEDEEPTMEDLLGVTTKEAAQKKTKTSHVDTRDNQHTPSNTTGINNFAPTYIQLCDDTSKHPSMIFGKII